MASQRRALKALIKNYATTCSHFEYIIANSTKDAAKVKGLLNRLRSPKFLTFLHFMMDFTQLIGSLSEAFQADNLLVMDVIPRVTAVMWSLVDMKSNVGDSISSITHGAKYMGVNLTGDVAPELGQLHTKLLDCAIDHIDTRLAALQRSPLKDFTVFNYREWPDNNKDLAAYGKGQIQSILQQFASVLTEEELEAAPMEWMNFKLAVSKQRTSDPIDVYGNLLALPPKGIRHFLPLLEIMMTLSMSTAIVERGFSHMNIVKSATHTSLGNNSMNDLLEIKINGPSLSNFKADEAIIHWLDKANGKRRMNGHTKECTHL